MFNLNAFTRKLQLEVTAVHIGPAPSSGSASANERVVYRFGLTLSRATCEYDDTRTCSCMSPYPHTRRSGNATAATCTRRLLQVSVRPVLSVYPQSYLQFTCKSKSSKCKIKLYSMIKCSAKSLVPTWHTLLGMGRIQNNLFERQLWPVLVTCTLLARYLPLLAVARRCSCS
jgi:hypothetical protein